MRQLNGIDVSFLNMETPTTFGHVSSVTIYDPSNAPGGAGLEATKEIILERIGQLAPRRGRRQPQFADVIAVVRGFPRLPVNAPGIAVFAAVCPSTR